jgi:hypothetical protein
MNTALVVAVAVGIGTAAEAVRPRTELEQTCAMLLKRLEKQAAQGNFRALDHAIDSTRRHIARRRQPGQKGHAEEVTRTLERYLADLERLRARMIKPKK